MGFRQWRRGESVKVLEVGSLALFGVLVLYTLIAAPEWTVATVRLAVDGGLLLIVLMSLAIGMPFTLQYARESVPKEFWTAPLFITTNQPHHRGLGGRVRGHDRPPTRPRNMSKQSRSGSTLRRRSPLSSARYGSRDGMRRWCGAASACRRGKRRVMSARPAPSPLAERDGRGLARADAHEAHRLVQAAQCRAILGDVSAGQRLARFRVGQHRLRDDRLAAAALMFEPRSGVHRRAEIIKHVAGGDGDA